MRRTNWDKARPAMQRAPVESGIWGYVKNPTVEELDEPEEWYWLCPSCGALLPYLKHRSYPLHCGVRCRILHHMELGYVISEAETLRQAREEEVRAYREWRSRLTEFHHALLKEKRDTPRSDSEVQWRWDNLEEAARRCQHKAWAVDGRHG